MTKRTKALLVSLLVTAVVSVTLHAYAGFQHTPGGRTTYDPTVQTPATAWLRQHKTPTTPILWPAARILIFLETPRYLTYNAVNDPTDNHPVALGYWTIDSNGDYWPDTGLAEAEHDGNQLTLGLWADVEWYLDSDGIMWPRN